MSDTFSAVKRSHLFEFVCEVPFSEGTVKRVIVTITPSTHPRLPADVAVRVDVERPTTWGGQYGVFHEYLDNEVTYGVAAEAVRSALREAKIARSGLWDITDGYRLANLDHAGYLAVRAAELAQYEAATGSR